MVCSIHIIKDRGNNTAGLKNIDNSPEKAMVLPVISMIWYGFLMITNMAHLIHIILALPPHTESSVVEPILYTLLCIAFPIALMFLYRRLEKRDSKP